MTRSNLFRLWQRKESCRNVFCNTLGHACWTRVGPVKAGASRPGLLLIPRARPSAGAPQWQTSEDPCIFVCTQHTCVSSEWAVTDLLNSDRFSHFHVGVSTATSKQKEHSGLLWQEFSGILFMAVFWFTFGLVHRVQLEMGSAENTLLSFRAQFPNFYMQPAGPRPLLPLPLPPLVSQRNRVIPPSSAPSHLAY